MPTTEDNFYVYIIITDEDGKEVIRKQLIYIDHNPTPAEPITHFDFDGAVEFMNEAALRAEDVVLRERR